LLDELAEATLDGTRTECPERLVTVALLIVDDVGVRKLPLTAAEKVLEIVMPRLRADQHARDFESTCRGLGQAAGRCRCHLCHGSIACYTMEKTIHSGLSIGRFSGDHQRLVSK